MRTPVEHSTINLDKERRKKLVILAQQLGYVSQYRMERTGNITGLIRAIADGEVRVIKISTGGSHDG